MGHLIEIQRHGNNPLVARLFLKTGRTPFRRFTTRKSASSRVVLFAFCGSCSTALRFVILWSSFLAVRLHSYWSEREFSSLSALWDSAAVPQSHASGCGNIMLHRFCCFYFYETCFQFLMINRTAHYSGNSAFTAINL